MSVSFDDVRTAAARIEPHIHRTPVMRCRAVDEAVGTTVFLKCENLQRGGAFKARGAHNAVWSLSDEDAVRGVAAHSSGNHAAALALAGRSRGIPVTVVMPENAPRVKRAAVESYGGHVVTVDPTERARAEGLAEVLARTGAVPIHPYDDDHIIAGHGTATLELLDQVPDLDVVIGPIGGGSLMSGTAIAGHGLVPGLRVLGAEPALDDDAARSIAAGHVIASRYPPSIADGLLTSLCERTLAILSAHLEQVVAVDEDEIVAAMRILWERAKLVVEPSGAASLAGAVAAGRRGELEGSRVGVILSGGNVDLDRLPWH